MIGTLLLLILCALLFPDVARNVLGLIAALVCFALAQGFH